MEYNQDLIKKVIIGWSVVILLGIIIYSSVKEDKSIPSLENNQSYTQTFNIDKKEYKNNQLPDTVSYSEKLYSNLSQGDVSNKDCSEAWQTYINKSTVSEGRYLYDFNKKRCLAFIYWSSKENRDGSDVEDSGEMIFDLILYKTIYRKDISKIDGNYNFIDISDYLGGSWKYASYDNNTKLPPEDILSYSIETFSSLIKAY